MKHFLFLLALVVLGVPAQSQNVINNVLCDVKVCEVCYDPNDPGIVSWPCNVSTITGNCVTVGALTTAPLPPKQCPLQGLSTAWQVCWASPWCDPNVCVIIEDGPGGTPAPTGAPWVPCFDHHFSLPACNSECGITCVSFANTSPDMEIY